MERRVVIVHPFVQEYRRPLYERLAQQLADEGRRLVVVWNRPAPRLEARANSIEDRWTQRVPSRWVEVGSREVVMRRLGVLDLGAEDLVIVEQAIKNLETYPLLAERLIPRGALRGPGVAMWGHGRSYSTPQAQPLAGFKQWLTHRMDWFFAYTQAGADHVIRHGFRADRVTVLNNTIDTVALRRDLEDVAEIESFRSDLGLTPGRTALFLGGVDRAKGIDFLLESAHLAAEKLPGFSLVIGGAGDDLRRLNPVVGSGSPVRMLGRVDGAQKARALTAADVMTIPQWIGLVAVDALVAGRPIVSTVHPSHSPEREYLVDGRTAVFTRHDPHDYATAIIDLLGDPERLSQMQDACRSDADAFKLDHMVDAFMGGIRGWAEARSA